MDDSFYNNNYLKKELKEFYNYSFSEDQPI